MGTNLLVAMTLLLAADSPSAEAVSEGLKAYQGVWTPESMEQDGKMLDPARLAKVRLSIDGEKFTFETAVDSHSGLYKIDPTKDPKQLDIHVTRGAEEGKVYFVIYKFAGGKMIQCMRVDNNGRAKDFTGKAGSGNLYEIWKKVE